MIYVFFLLLVTAVWGWTFVLVKDAISQYPTLPFLELRFILAFLVMAAIVRTLPTGREVRVVVKPEQLDDLQTARLSRDIAQKIQDTLQYPGQVKVTVIRETRAVEYAK